jgi:hypothetical protein
MPITLQNQSPANGETDVSVTANIQVDVITSLAQSQLGIYVEGTLAFYGADLISPFRFPYIGPSSSVSIIVGGYRIVLDRIEDSRKEFINVQVRQTDGYSSSLVGGWSFRAGQENINDFYLSDGYRDAYGQLNPEPGVRRLHVRQLVGEWKPYDDAADNLAMPVVLSTAVTPNWPSDIVHSLSSQMKDGYMFLVASTDQGTAVTKNETADLRVYADGYDSYNGHLTVDGTLYLINLGLNGGLGGVEVYYGADFRTGSRAPDFIYDSSLSTPERVRLLGGQLTALHVAEDVSTVLDGGSRLYVGCLDGFTKIEAYDQGTDGYCDGYDGYGRAYTYGIVGSPTNYPILGGTVSAVAAINSEEEDGILFVATNDGTEVGGGLSQISISRNIRLLFMTKESGQLPSNVIKDISNK